MASKSLISVSTNGLPECLSGLPCNVDTGSGFEKTPYIVYFHPRQKIAPDVLRQIPDASERDVILVRGDTFTRLNPFKFYFVTGQTYYTKMDSQGFVIGASRDAEITKEDGDYKEHIEAFILVVLPDGSHVPATARFRSTKSRAAKSAARALADASDDRTWGEKSPEHKATLGIKTIYARFFMIASTFVGTTKGGRNAGNTYVVADAKPIPTGVADWKALSANFQDPGFLSLSDVTYGRYKDRIADLDAEL